MTSSQTFRRALAVCGATAVLLALGASLAIRAAGRDGAAPTPTDGAVRLPAAPVPDVGHVPAPRPLQLADVPMPRCWSCEDNQWAKLEVDLDLDLLAPLGDGSSNFALWFATLGSSKDPDGQQERLVMHPVQVDGKEWRVLAFDDPLLAEAEPWLAQSTCRFYPDVWGLDNLDAPLPNLLSAIRLSRTFIARGRLSDDPVAALEDYRRAARLGRLLMQERSTLIQDLVGIACLRMGVEGMALQAREQGDALTVAATASVLADLDAMRARSAARISVTDAVWRQLRVSASDAPRLEATDHEIAAVFNLVRKSKDRSFRFEALYTIKAIAQLANPEQRAEAELQLQVAEKDADPLIAQRAHELRGSTLSDEEIAKIVRNTRE